MNDAFSAYIIDWRLPDMNGIEVTRQIRSLGDDTPIIILTAYDWNDIEEEAKAAGVTGFCSKPMFMSDLRDTLLDAFGRLHKEKESIMPDALVYRYFSECFMSALLKEENYIPSSAFVLNNHMYRFCELKMTQLVYNLLTGCVLLSKSGENIKGYPLKDSPVVFSRLRMTPLLKYLPL